MADRYWVGGAGTWDTTSTTNWSTSTGGGSGASVPTSADSVFFDQAGTYTVTMTGSLACLDITVSAGTVTFASGAGPSLAIYGSMTLIAGTVWSTTGGIALQAATTGKTITTNGVSITSTINCNSAAGGWTLGSALTCVSINFSNGTFSTSASNYSITASGSLAVGGGTLNLNDSTISLSGGAPFTYTSGTVTGTGIISLTRATAKTFAGGGYTFNCTLNQGGAGALTITGSNTFSNITNTYNATGATTIQFTAGTTNTFTDWNASGAAGKLLIIGSVTAASHTLSKASGTVNASFLSISYSTAAGGATWNATDSIDSGNNTGWNITAPVSSVGFLLFF